MTTAKTQIINRLMNTITNLINPVKVVRKLVLLEEVNDFPFVCVLASSERRIHNGAGERIGIIDVVIRGYVHDEANLDSAEALGVDLDSVVASFMSQRCENGVFDARINSLRTDEGLFEPYGILDVNLEIFYIIPTMAPITGYVFPDYVLDDYVEI